MIHRPGWYIHRGGVPVVLLQMVLLAIAYTPWLAHPLSFSFANAYDGANNLFLLQTYVERLDSGLLHIQGLNYVWGDYLWYGDIMPLFAVPYKAFCLYIYDISAWVIPAYHLWVMLSMLLCGWLLWRIFRHYHVPQAPAVVLGAVLPWLSFELMRRTGTGHINISQSWPLLWLLLALLRYPQPGLPLRAYLRPAAVLGLCLLVGSWTHPYWLIILLLTGLAYLAVLAVVRTLASRSPRTLLPYSMAGAALVLAAALQIALVTGTDTQRHQRPMPGGYNWDYWNARWEALVLPPYQPLQDHATLNPAPAQLVVDWGYEGMSYLGSWLLAGLALLALLLPVYLLGRRYWRLPPLSLPPYHRLQLLALLLAGLAMWLIALGDDMRLGPDRVPNPLSLFYWVHKLTPAVENFRNLSRLGFPLYWVLAIGACTVLWHGLWPRRWGRPLLAALALLLLADTYDRLRFLHPHHFAWITEDPLYTHRLPPGLQPVRYSALLPIPYYHTGNEVPELTIDPEWQWQNQTFVWVHQTGLPCLCSKMGRTPPHQARALYGIFDQDLQVLAQQGDTRPILVVVDTLLPRIHYPDAKLYAATILKKEETFVHQNRAWLRPLGTVGSRRFYSWQWHGQWLAQKKTAR